MTSARMRTTPASLSRRYRMARALHYFTEDMDWNERWPHWFWHWAYVTARRWFWRVAR